MSAAAWFSTRCASASRPTRCPGPMASGAAADIGGGRVLLVPGSLDVNPQPDPLGIDMSGFRPTDTSLPTAEPTP